MGGFSSDFLKLLTLDDYLTGDPIILLLVALYDFLATMLAATCLSTKFMEALGMTITEAWVFWVLMVLDLIPDSFLGGEYGDLSLSLFKK